MQALYQLSYSPELRRAGALRTRRSLAGDLPQKEIRSVVVAEYRLRQRPGVVLQEPPAARALAQHRPAAVGQPAERLPGIRAEAEQPPDGGADRAAMADHDERAAVRQLVGGLRHDRGGPVGHLGLQLAAAAPHRLTA